MAPISKDNQFTRFDHLQGLHALLEFWILRSETSSWFLQATHHGHQDAIAELYLDLKVSGILLCTLPSLRREGWHEWTSAIPKQH